MMYIRKTVFSNLRKYTLRQMQFGATSLLHKFQMVQTIIQADWIARIKFATTALNIENSHISAEYLERTPNQLRERFYYYVIDHFSLG